MRLRSPWELFPGLKDSPLQSAYREAMEVGKPAVLEHRSVVNGDWLEVRIYPTAADGFYLNTWSRLYAARPSRATAAWWRARAATSMEVVDGLRCVSTERLDRLPHRHWRSWSPSIGM